MTNCPIKTIFFGLLTTLAFPCFSQQTPYIANYRYNWQVVNPAAMDKSFIFGENRPFIISGTYRQQWIGKEYSPAFFYASMEHKPVNDNNFSFPVKWGFQGFGDVTDGYETFGMYGNFSYFFPFLNPRGQFLHIGISGGVIQQGVALSADDFDEMEEGFSDESNWYADFSIGIFYRHERLWYLGLSSPQTLSPALGSVPPDGKRWLPTERTNHFYLMGGGFIESQIEGIIEPSIWIRYAPGLGYQTLGANIPLSTDLNLRYHSYGRRDEMTFWTGGGVSTSKYFHVEAGMHLPLGALLNDPSDKVSMGITLSFPFAQNGLNLGNSAELTIAYAMD